MTITTTSSTTDPLPSLKALGKRRLVSPPPPPVAPAAPPPAAGGVTATKAERRVTRSSLPGPGSIDSDGKNGNGDPSQIPLYLPIGTPVLLTLQAPPQLTYHPPISLEEAEAKAEEGASTSTSTITAMNGVGVAEKEKEEEKEKPAFRLLGPGDTFTKSRHISPLQADLSDAHFHRLHRYPEVLEKRSARLERERLIHERAQLMMEIEGVRSRNWVYGYGFGVGGGGSGGGGGRGGEERKRKLRELEERLKRYDALLPQQPRKSGFLNTSTIQPPGVGGPRSRDGSPASALLQRRHATPVSASGDGGTTIRIKFAAGGGGGGGGRGGGGGGGDGKKRKFGGESAGEEADEEGGDGEEEEDDIFEDELGKRKERKERKRDRRAERERARLRKELASHGQGGGASRITDKPLPPPKPRSTFFASEAARDSASLGMLGESTSATGIGTKSTGGGVGGGRRSSGRSMYAFGQKLPEGALSRHKEFVLYGGIATPSPSTSSSSAPPPPPLIKPEPPTDDEPPRSLHDPINSYDSGIPLETLVRERNKVLNGDTVTPPSFEFDFVNGVAVPSSSLAAIYTSPIRGSVGGGGGGGGQGMRGAGVGGGEGEGEKLGHASKGAGASGGESGSGSGSGLRVGKGSSKPKFTVEVRIDR